MREHFERALASDPYDIQTRLIFADWLEERGLDDEAREHRRRATERWCGADRGLRALADRLYVYGDDKILNGYVDGVRRVRDRDEALRELIRAGELYASQGRFSQVGSDLHGFDASGLESEESAVIVDFWRLWRDWTGKDVPVEDFISPFTCCGEWPDEGEFRECPGC